MSSTLPPSISQGQAPQEAVAPVRSRAGDLERLRAGFTETERVILERRSVRKYTKEQVPEWMVKRILEAGRFAPSGGNYQPWKFIVVREENVIAELTEDAVQVAKAISHRFDYRREGRGWLFPLTKLMTRLRPGMMHPTPFSAVSMLAEGRITLYYGAPTVILILKDVRGIGSPDLDCGIAGQNMVLAAHSMGLGTCWVGFVGLAVEQRKWRRFFGVEFPYAFASSIGVGWSFAEPDGMVTRQTHPVDWYEAGERRTWL